MVMKRVAVVGAGACGLVAIKACLEEGLEPVCFERTDHIGGLWYYTEQDVEGQACVAKTTEVNTAKEIMCYSDFPFPRDFPNYMRHGKVLEYYRLYAKLFDLEKYIQFQVEVLKVARADDFLQSGQWKLEIRDQATQQTKVEIFDAVLLCSGHHVEKYMPRFEGEDVYKGRIMHSKEFRSHKGFEEKRVLLVGIGNSAVDAAVDLSKIAEQVYVSTRHGSWVLGRMGTNGMPLQYELLRRSSMFISSLLPFSVTEAAYEKRVSRWFDHAMYGLKPKHSILATHILLSDEFPNRILSGSIIVKSDIKRFTETGVEFDDGSKAEDIDIVIFGTGYTFGFPFLEKGIIDVDQNKAELYKYVFPTHLEHNTLAAIGFVQPLGAINPIAEMQCRWATRVFKGLMKLPGRSTMLANIQQKREAMAKRYVDSIRHTIQVDYIPYMDELGEQFGAKPRLGLMMLTDPRLAIACIFGPWSPYQYRLRGPGQWSGARQAILTMWDRILAPLQTRPVPTVPKNRMRTLVRWLFLLALCVGAWKLSRKLKLELKLKIEP